MVADTVNALLYVAEGDYMEAGKSVLAAIPVIGEQVAVAKRLKKAATVLSEWDRVMTAEGIYQKAQDAFEFFKYKLGLQKVAWVKRRITLQLFQLLFGRQLISQISTSVK